MFGLVSLLALEGSCFHGLVARYRADLMPTDLRSKGRIAAAVAFTVVVGVIVWAVRNQQRVPSASPVPGGGGGGSGSAVVDPAAVPPPPTAATGGAPGAGSGNLLAGSGVGTWTRANPRTGVIESRLDYEKLTPLPAGRYEIEQPGAWLFSSGVARAHVSAPRATVVWPTREEPPEAGDLLGGVLVRVFDASTPQGQTPSLDSALYTLQIESVHFEGAMSQLESTDPLTVKGPGVSVEGTGLTLRFSPATKRLQYARTTGKRAVIDPSALSRGVERVRATGGDGGAGRGEKPADSTAAKPTPLDPCELVLSGSLRIVQGARSVNAESLSVLAMLQGGRLPDGAFAPFEPVKPAGNAGAPGGDGDASAAKSGVVQPPIEFAWNGPLEFRNLAEPPAALGKDLLRAVFASPANSRVKMIDGESGAELDAASVAYGATTRTLAIAGPGVSLRVTPKRGSEGAAGGGETLEVAAERIDLDFTSGVGAIPGAGKITSVPSGVAAGEAGTTVAWRGRADFILDTTDGPAGTAGIFLPQRVTLSEAVTAKTADGEAGADLADIRFRRVAPAGADRKPTAIPSEITLTDAASAVTKDGVVRADRLTLAFAEMPDDRGRAVPRAASGRGRAVAEQTGKNGAERIEAEAIDAVLSRDPQSGKSGVSSLVAERGVIYSGRDGVKASADRLDAEVPTQRVALVGAPAVVGRYEGATGRSQRLAAERINLDGVAKSVTVPGPGEGTYDDPSERMVITWQREMTYDDAKGETVLVGGVAARAARADTDRYNTEGDRAVVRLGPVVSSVVDGKPQSRRDLESVTIERVGADSPKPIEVTARRFIAGQPLASVNANAAKMEGMIHLKGPSVTVMPAKRAMRVPGPGLILLDDRRSLAEAKRETGGEQSGAIGPGGRSVIEWSGKLDTIESSGTLRLDGGVRVRHQPIGATQTTTMEAGALALDLEWPQPGGASPSGGESMEPRLRRVLADGGVGVVHQRLRFTGDSMSFDAGSNEVLIVGNPERPVTINDAESGTTTTAQAVALDPRAGTWRVTQAGTITVPR